MQPPCSGRTSSSQQQPCFSSCFLSPFLVSENSHDNTSNSNTVNRTDDLTSATSSSLSPNTHFTNHESLPLLHESYNNFIKAFPQFSTTCEIDEIREQEYHHLNNSLSNICFDYTGYGLFSYVQQNQNSGSIASCSSSSSTRYLNLEQSFFDVSIKSMNLKSQILYGGHESEIESRIRERIMTFMNVSETDYALVFIANEVSAFKLVADSFQFQSKGSELLTVYDHNNEALEMMIDSCKKQGVQILSAEFTWPNLGIEWRKLKKMITCKKEKRKENGWCVMLDLCALRPKEMDTLDLGNATSIGIISIVPTLTQCNTSNFSRQNDTEKSNFRLPEFSTPEIQKSKTKKKQVEVEVTSSSTSEVVELQGMNMKDEKLEIECRGLDHAHNVGLIVISTRTRFLDADFVEKERWRYIALNQNTIEV
ncbi:molybdenum cofactor sulfurase-like protein [Trifolium pratense]|uniref:Molybdenum cofactor sulfurase-like protein n=1 Tax=Trifolium pratense TaxID=57577 RepID=A0A2K3P125_TRIPR|nr:molybdenum cofactor sulfurase-like protein [Trifolium pratense]